MMLGTRLGRRNTSLLWTVKQTFSLTLRSKTALTGCGSGWGLRVDCTALNVSCSVMTRRQPSLLITE